MVKLTWYTATLLAVLGADAGSASGQEYVVAVAEENFRARPNGAKLGTLKRGAPLDALSAQGRWVKASLRGWIWKPSVKAIRGRSGVMVDVARENLRATPGPKAQVLGTIFRGTSLAKVSEGKSWIQVSYDGWIWQASLKQGTAEADPPSAAPSTAPSRTVAIERENLRATPGGGRLGALRRGTDLAVLSERDRWVEVSTRGYFYATSATGSGSTRRVGKASENLRLAPGSEIVGVLTRGTPLRVLSRAGRWLEVEVRGWMWKPSTLSLGPASEGRAPSTTADAGNPPPAVPTAAPASPGGESRSAGTDAGDPAPARDERPAPSTPRPPSTLRHSVPLKDGPDGRLVGQALTGAPVVPLRTEGDWVKVRVEGWIPREALGQTGAGNGSPTIPMVIADPLRYRGATVTWRLELIAVAQADGSRTDFRTGEHYLLTRNAEGEREYVYVVVPAAMVERFRGLEPFAPITVRGSVRTGRSDLVGNPILEYRELLPAR